MQPGCGLKVRKIGGRWYLYVWHCENGGARSQKVEVYKGPAIAAKARARALRSLLEQEERARTTLDRRIASYRSALARVGEG